LGNERKDRAIKEDPQPPSVYLKDTGGKLSSGTGAPREGVCTGIPFSDQGGGCTEGGDSYESKKTRTVPLSNSKNAQGDVVPRRY